MRHDQDQRKRWLDDPRNVKRLYYALLAASIALILSDLLYPKQTHFAWEGWFGFFGIFGFVSFFFLVLAGKQFRRLVMRDEDYYDR
jgi:hypothetical protein